MCVNAGDSESAEQEHYEEHAANCDKSPQQSCPEILGERGSKRQPVVRDLPALDSSHNTTDKEKQTEERDFPKRDYSRRSGRVLARMGRLRPDHTSCVMSGHEYGANNT